MAVNPMTTLIDLVNAEAGRLAHYLAGMRTESWTQDSACQGWKIGDVVAHLSIAASTWAASLTRAAAGDAEPPQGQSFLGAGVRGSEIIADAATSHFQEKGQQLLDEFTQGYDRLKQVMSTLRPEDWEKPCFHRRGKMPVQQFVALRVQELAVHSWDIRAGLDSSAAISEEALPQLVTMVPRWLRNAFRPGLDLPTPVRYRFDVTGAERVSQDVVVNGQEFEILAAGSGRADVTFRCDTGNYILLIYGRIGVDQGVTSGRLSSGRLNIEGPTERAAEFTTWFQGF